MSEKINFYSFFQKKNEEKESNGIIEIPVDEIKPNPNQPRKNFNIESINELVLSIKEFGVMQPITVRLINGHIYELVCGERRLRAAKVAEFKTIPSIVVKTNDSKSALMAITENIQRQNLNFIEEAISYQSLINDYGFTQEEVAQKLGKSQSSIANKIRILRLNDNVKNLLIENNLTERHGRALLRLPCDEFREDVIEEVINNKLNVKLTEELVEKKLEKIKDEYKIIKEQKVKRNFGDIRLITNTIKRSVEIMKNSGIDAVYNVEEKEGSYKIIIDIPN